MNAAWIQSHLPTLYHLVCRLQVWTTRRSSWRISTWWPSDSRSAKQQSLLRLLVFAHRQRIDPASLVANLASEHRGVYRWRLRQLAQRLAEGTAVIDALERTPDVLSDETVLAIRYAGQTGTLNVVGQSLIDRDTETAEQATRSMTATMVYCFGMLLAFGSLLTFLLIAILPQNMRIYQDFQLRPPSAASQLIAVSSFIFDHGPVLMMTALLLAWLCCSPTSRRFFRRNIASRWFSSSEYTRSVHLLRLFALTTKSGRPLTSALSSLGRYHFDAGIRNKLLYARNEIEQGTEAWAALAKTHLLSSQEALSLAALSRETQAWGLNRLADERQQRIDRRRQRRADRTRTLVILGFAAIVLWLCFAFLDPLAKMLA